VFPGDPDYYDNWVVNGPNSDWIARNAGTPNNGLGTYTRTFDLTGFDLSSVSIAGSWAIDDIGTLSLNGHEISSLLAPGPSAWATLTPFSVAAGSPFLNQGLNTLTITITASDNSLEGVRLEGALSETTTAVPEPSAMLLAGLGLLGMAPMVRRQK